MERETCAKFVSLKASNPLISGTRVSNLMSSIIYPEITKNR